jgi:hypothetical protein
MSKLSVIRQYQQSPAAGGLFTGILNVGKTILKAITGSKAVTTVAKIAKSPVGQAALYTGAAIGAESLLSAGKTPGPKGYSGGWGAGAGSRRGRGITARELRGYRKVARLLHKEGMVSKRARGRH